MRHFKKFPEGLVFEELLPIQKEFLMILTASSPSLEAYNNWFNFEREKEEIKTKDFTKEIKTPDDQNLLVAKFKKISLDEYKKELAGEHRKKALKELQEKYGIKNEEEKEVDERSRVLNHYEKISKQFENNEIIKKIKNIDKFFSKPEGIDG